MIAGDWDDATTKIEKPRPRLPAAPVWLVVVAAFLAGAALAAAAFVTVWRNEAGRSADAQALVSARDAQIAKLRNANAALAAKLAADARALSAGAARAKALEKRRAAAVAEAKRLSARVDELAAAAAKTKRAGGALAASAATLASDLKGLSSYLTQTSVSQLDPSYLATQLDYLKKLAARLQADGSALG